MSESLTASDVKTSADCVGADRHASREQLRFLLARSAGLQKTEIGDGWRILLAEGALLLHAGRVLRVDVAADRRVKADEPAGPVIASA